MVYQLCWTYMSSPWLPGPTQKLGMAPLARISLSRHSDRRSFCHSMNPISLTLDPQAARHFGPRRLTDLQSSGFHPKMTFLRHSQTAQRSPSCSQFVYSMCHPCSYLICFIQYSVNLAQMACRYLRGRSLATFYLRFDLCPALKRELERHALRARRPASGAARLRSLGSAGPSVLSDWQHQCSTSPAKGHALA